jgi:hypothetical protein
LHVVGLTGYQKTTHRTLTQQLHIPVSPTTTVLKSNRLKKYVSGQKSFDPYNSNAGDGLLPNGSWVTPVPNPTNAYTPWNTTLAKQWLSGLKNKPTVVTIDNEIEIASSTHQDMHPK